MTDQPERAECRNQNGIPCDIVPFLDGSDSFVGGNDRKNRGPQEISKYRDEDGNRNQNAAEKSAEAKNFAKKERGHDAALERPDSAACLLHAQRACGKGDEMSSPHGLITSPVENLQSRHGIFLHEETHDRFLGVARPWDGDQEEGNRKQKMPHPGESPERVNKEERQQCGAERAKNPGNPPLRVCFKKGLHGQKKTKCR